MSYIHSIDIDDQSYIIEPLLFTTASGTSTEIIANISNFVLVPGAYVNVKVGTVGTNATLNVNSTGAKNIYYNSVPISAGMLVEDNIYTFIYDGTNWALLGDIIGKNIVIHTTAEWGANSSYKPPRGTIVIYSDKGTLTEIVNNTEVTKNVPGIKIGDGSTFVNSLPFVNDDVLIPLRNELDAHVSNNIRHITAEERTKWNNKITCADRITGHTLVITKN